MSSKHLEQRFLEAFLEVIAATDDIALALAVDVAAVPDDAAAVDDAATIDGAVVADDTTAVDGVKVVDDSAVDRGSRLTKCLCILLLIVVERCFVLRISINGVTGVNC